MSSLLRDILCLLESSIRIVNRISGIKYSYAVVRGTARAYKCRMNRVQAGGCRMTFKFCVSV